MIEKEKIESLLQLAIKAGAEILKVYQQADFDVQLKNDNSPLTQADLASHNIIADGLKRLYPDVPIISEEGTLPTWQERQKYKTYWLIDPLDGTKEFVKRNGEFTVNIALISEHRAVFGVVYAPVKKLIYYGGDGVGAFKQQGSSDKPQVIAVKAPPANQEEWKIVGSRSHQSDAFREFVAQFTHADIVSLGSSLKLCIVAEGSADLYPRLGPTSEWDTAAAHAVVEAAGGQVINWETKKPLLYNTKESLLNSEFIVCAKPVLPWFDQSQDVNDIRWHNMDVTKELRASRLKQKPAIVWFTGLSGSGKSTSASFLEKLLFEQGYNTYILDGDNVRHGLCSDLGFTDRDRSENIRRVGEVAKLMVDAGLIVLVAFISPFVRERQMVRQMVKPGEFLEVYMKTPIETCEQRDPKGLYRKARDGHIKNFTGIDSPYEEPEEPEIEIDTNNVNVDEVVKQLVAGLTDYGIIK